MIGRRVRAGLVGLAIAVLWSPALPAGAAGVVSMVGAPEVDCGAPGSGFCFRPVTITIQAGESVTWTNNSTAPHTATADDDSWSTPRTAPWLPRGQSASVRFDRGETFPYRCTLHPDMRGTVIVAAAQTPTPTPPPTATPPPTTPPPGATPTPRPATTPTPRQSPAPGLAQTGGGSEITWWPPTAFVALLGMALLGMVLLRRDARR
jgi:plastocyanin